MVPNHNQDKTAPETKPVQKSTWDNGAKLKLIDLKHAGKMIQQSRDSKHARKMTQKSDSEHTR